MPFLAPIGVALGVASTATTAAAIVGGLAVAGGGLAVAGLAKSVIGGSRASGQGSGVSVSPVPSVPTTGQASAAASQITKDQKRRSTTRVTSSQDAQQNLLANPSTTKKTLLGS